MSGKLTAEQVRELIAPHLDARPTFDFGRHGAAWSADFQAIADELNAALGGECEDISTKNGIFKCSKCGCTVEEDGVDWGGINYCPDCGGAVEL